MDGRFDDDWALTVAATLSELDVLKAAGNLRSVDGYVVGPAAEVAGLSLIGASKTAKGERASPPTCDLTNQVPLL